MTKLEIYHFVSLLIRLLFLLIVKLIVQFQKISIPPPRREFRLGPPSSPDFPFFERSDDPPTPLDFPQNDEHPPNPSGKVRSRRKSFKNGANDRN